MNDPLVQLAEQLRDQRSCAQRAVRMAERDCNVAAEGLTQAHEALDYTDAQYRALIVLLSPDQEASHMMDLLYQP